MPRLPFSLLCAVDGDQTSVDFTRILWVCAYPAQTGKFSENLCSRKLRRLREIRHLMKTEREGFEPPMPVKA